MNLRLPETWNALVQNEYEKSYYKKLEEIVTNEYNKQTVYPAEDEIFKAFQLTPYANVKCVILA